MLEEVIEALGLKLQLWDTNGDIVNRNSLSRSDSRGNNGGKVSWLQGHSRWIFTVEKLTEIFLNFKAKRH